jgi:hypothetical protein
MHSCLVSGPERVFPHQRLEAVPYGVGRAFQQGGQRSGFAADIGVHQSRQRHRPVRRRAQESDLALSFTGKVIGVGIHAFSPPLPATGKALPEAFSSSFYYCVENRQPLRQSGRLAHLSGRNETQFSMIPISSPDECRWGFRKSLPSSFHPEHKRRI